MVGRDKDIWERGEEHLPHEQTKQTSQYSALVVKALPSSPIDHLDAMHIIDGRIIKELQHPVLHVKQFTVVS